MLTNKQLSYIKVLEEKSKLKFYGTTTEEMSKFVERAKQAIEDYKLIQRKLTKEDKRFPFPDLKNDLPTEKQWAFIRSLEEKTKWKFDGITKKEATDYIDMALQLIQVLP